MKIHLFYTMHRHGMHFVFKMEIKKKNAVVLTMKISTGCSVFFLGRKLKYQGIRVYISKACFATGFFY